METQRLERLREPGLIEILRDHLGPRGQARLHPRFAAQAPLDGLLRHEPGGHHHRRVRRVGAARDGGNDDGAVAQYVLDVVDAERGVRRPGRRGRFQPNLTAFALPPSHRNGVHHGYRRRLHQRRQRLRELARHLAQPHAILRPAWARHARLHRCQVELQHVGIGGFGSVGRVEQALLLHVRFDQLDLLARASREFEIPQRFLIDREYADRRPIFRRHVADRGPIGQGQRRDAGPEELDELSDDSLGAQHLRDREHEIGRSGTFAQTAAEAKSDDLWDEHRDRLPQHRRFRLDSTYAPANHAEAIDHRGV